MKRINKPNASRALSRWEQFKFNPGLPPSKYTTGYLICAGCDKVLGADGTTARATKLPDNRKMYHCEKCYNTFPKEYLIKEFLQRVTKDKATLDMQLKVEALKKEEVEDTKKFNERQGLV